MIPIQPLSRLLRQRPALNCLRSAGLPSLLTSSSSTTTTTAALGRCQFPRTWARFASTEAVDNPASSAAPDEVPISTFSAPFMPPPNRESKGRGFQMITYKPRTPGLRHLKRVSTPWVWKGGPYLPLTFPKKGHGKGGRNNSGRITVRHRGGGHARRIRTVDFMRMSPGPHLVERIEKDPGRSGHIALVTNQETLGKSYILAADGVRAGDIVQSYRSGIPADLLASMGGIVDPGVLAARTAWRGNCLPLHMIPVGTVIHAVGSSSKGAAVFCRSAGTYATVISKSIKYGVIRLQSGEVRRVSRDAPATVGVVSNPTWHHQQLGKAGRKRWLNIRPTVRGVAMNSVDHPHGGGRGKSKGNRHPVSPWGIPTKSGYKTRPKNKPNKWVVTERVRNQGKRRVKSK